MVHVPYVEPKCYTWFFGVHSLINIGVTLYCPYVRFRLFFLHLLFMFSFTNRNVCKSLPGGCLQKYLCVWPHPDQVNPSSYSVYKTYLYSYVHFFTSLSFGFNESRYSKWGSIRLSVHYYHQSPYITLIFILWLLIPLKGRSKTLRNVIVHCFIIVVFYKLLLLQNYDVS